MKVMKWVLIGIASGIVVFMAYILLILYQGGFFNTSSKQELINNYKNNQKQILELKHYFNSIVPPDFNVYIEFKNAKKINLRATEKVDTSEFPILWFQQYDINPYQYNANPKTSLDSTKWAAKTNSLAAIKQKLKWNDDTFKKIKMLLDSANCISITNGEPSEIGFARSGMGEYEYLIFDKPIPDSLKATYNDGCEYIYYNDKLVLVWGSGVLGAQCFPDK